MVRKVLITEERNAAHASPGKDARRDPAMTEPLTPLWEVFIRAKAGLAHRHVGSVHAADAEMALQAARDDLHAARRGGVAVGRCRRGGDHCASDPGDEAVLFEPATTKPYRHPTFYTVPKEVGDM